MSDRKTQYKGKPRGRQPILTPEGEEYVYEQYIVGNLTGPKVQKLVKVLYDVELDLSTISRIATKIAVLKETQAAEAALDAETPSLFESSSPAA